METYYFNIDKLTVGYDSKPLISNINVELKKGEILTLIGPNGAGKTTILKSITGQLRTITGAIYMQDKLINNVGKINDNSVIYNKNELAKKMAVVLTEKIKTELYSCEDIVATGRYPYTGRFGILGEKDKAAVSRAMEKVHITEIKDKDFNSISDGQRQRVMLARAICQEPEILILDEPTSFLDIRHKLEFMAILQQMAREDNITIVMSLHELELAQRVSDKVMCIKGDKVDRIGTPEDIFSKGYVNELYDIKLGSYDEISGRIELPKIEGKPQVYVVAGNGGASAIYRQLQRKGIPFATGVIYENDIDYPVAKALASKVYSLKVGETISDELRQQIQREMDSCTIIGDGGSVLQDKTPVPDGKTYVMEKQDKTPVPDGKAYVMEKQDKTPVPDENRKDK